jgi:hypothetical protein
MLRYALVVALAVTSCAGERVAERAAAPSDPPAVAPSCPTPAVARPLVAERVPSPPRGQELIVLRWAPSPDDRLPIAYYRQVTVLEGDAPPAVQRVTLTAPREVTLELHDAGDFLTGQRDLAFTLTFPDVRTQMKCSHPGMADVHHVHVSVSFDREGRVKSTTMGDVETVKGAL